MGRAAFFAMGMSAVALVASVTMQPVAAGVATLEGPAAAVRGDAVQTQPMPDPPVVYPVGRCDTLVPGLPGLAPHTWPDRMVDLGRSVEARPIWAEYWGRQILIASSCWSHRPMGTSVRRRSCRPRFVPIRPLEPACG